MTGDADFQDSTLAPVLHRFAIDATERVLGVLVAGGVGLAVLALWSPLLGAVFFVSAGTALAMLGIWAWAEREVCRIPESRHRLLEVVRAVAGVVGSVAALGVAFAATAVLLGRWIS